jgi:hypothetical protein
LDTHYDYYLIVKILVAFYLKKFGFIIFNITHDAHNKANPVATFVSIFIQFVIFGTESFIVINTHAATIINNEITRIIDINIFISAHISLGNAFVWSVPLHGDVCIQSQTIGKQVFNFIQSEQSPQHPVHAHSATLYCKKAGNNKKPKIHQNMYFTIFIYCNL